MRLPPLPTSIWQYLNVLCKRLYGESFTWARDNLLWAAAMLLAPPFTSYLIYGATVDWGIIKTNLYIYAALFVLYLMVQSMRTSWNLYKGTATELDAAIEEKNSLLAAAPFVRFTLTNDYQSAVLAITNDGVGAEFRVALELRGNVSGRRTGIFGRWEHTLAPTTRIGRGETCRLVVGHLHMQSDGLHTTSWTVPWSDYQTTGKSESAFVNVLDGEKHGVLSSRITVHIQVVANPDLIEKEELDIELGRTSAKFLGMNNES
jgi:hypothetical protein